MKVNDDGVILGGGAFGGKHLSDVVGKEAAERILKQHNAGKLEGEGLKIGGEGMKGYYDAIVPQVMNGIAKKIGGGKVESIQIPIDTFRQPALILTPEMKAKAREGFALFQPKKVYTDGRQQSLDLGDPYETIDTRPGTTREEQSRGRAALGELRRRFGLDSLRTGDPTDRGQGSILGSRIDPDFVDQGGTTLVGQEVTGPKDFAYAAQVFRNPKFEVLRVFYLKDGKILGGQPYSSRLAGSVYAPDGIEDLVAKDKAMYGADSYVMLHNHTSAPATASESDMRLTQVIADAVPGFKYHVVIDHNEYYTIDQGSYGRVRGTLTKDEGLRAKHTAFDNPEIPHPLIGQQVAGPKDAARVAVSLQHDGFLSVFVTAGPVNKIGVIAEVPLSTLNANTSMAKLRLLAAVRRMSKEGGSDGHLFAVMPDSITPEQKSMLARSGIFTDIIDADGNSLSVRGAMIGGKIPRTKTEQGGMKAPKWYMAQQQGKYVNPQLPAETNLEAFQRKSQDDFNRFRVLQNWLKEQGVKITDKNNVYNAEIRMHGRYANKVEDFRQKTLYPLTQEAQKAGIPISQIAEYLHAQHAQERNEQIARINPKFNLTDKPGSGMTAVEANQIMAAASPEIVRLADKFQAITEGTKQIYVDSGKESPESIAAWDAIYKNYVPLRGGENEGFIYTGKGRSAGGKQKRAMGHGERDEYIVENIARMREHAYLEAEKNLVGKHLLALALDMNNSDVISVNKPEKRGAVMPGKKMWVVEDKGYPVASFGKKAEAQQYINALGRNNLVAVERMGDPQVQYFSRPMLADNEVAVYVSGQMVRLQLNDTILAQEYKKLGIDRVTGIMEVGRTINRWLSKAYTGYNPEFLLRNMRRDFATGLINITADYGAKTAGYAAKEYPSSFSEMLKYSMTGQSNPMIDLYRQHGGNVGAAWLSDIERVGRDIQSEFDKAAGVVNLLKDKRIGAASSVAFEKGIGHVMGWIEHLNAAGENAMRLSVFKALLDAGKSPEEAAVAAKSMTVNFNKHGEAGQFMSSLWLFYNPAVQDAARLMKSLAKSDHKGQAWALVGGLAMMAFLTALMQYGDDNGDEWKEIPDNIKNKNLIFRIPGTKKYLTWDVPYGYGWFFSLGNAAYSAMLGEDPKKIAIRTAAGFLDNFSPVGNPLDASGKVVPWELAPFEPFRNWLRFSNNRSTFGNPIMPEENQYSPKPDHMRMWRSTKGGYYDTMTQWMNDKTGGTKTRPGAIDVSPETLKWLVNTVGGGTAQFMSDSMHLMTLGARAPFTPESEREGLAPDIREIPIVRGMVKEESIQWSRSRFHELANEAVEEAKAFRLASKERDKEGMKESDREKALRGLAHASESFSKAIGKLREREVTIHNDAVHSEGWKRLQLKQLEVDEQKFYDKFFNLYGNRMKKAA